MDNPWNFLSIHYMSCNFHGLSMEQVTPDSMSFPWVFAHMKSPWLVHGIPMVYTPWVFHGQSMVISYGQKPMENPWQYHGVYTMGIHSMEYSLCRHHGITMALPWVFHGSTMVILWCLHHGYSMVISYGQKPMENSWNLVSLVP